MAWDVEFHAQFVPEFEAFAEAVQDELLAHVTVLEVFGPHLGRPRVDKLHGSRYANMKELHRIRKTLSPARRRRIGVRALQNLRRSHGMTQTAMAQALGIGQDGVSRLEQRRDMRLSTLRGYVEALGGRLSVVADFPGQAPVVLSGPARGARAVPSEVRPELRASKRRSAP